MMGLAGRRRRWGRLTIVALVVWAGIFIAKGIIANGVFASVTPGFAGSCKAVGGIPGVADMELAGRNLFIAAANARGPGPQDGIYVLNLDGPAKLTRLVGTPKDFHPRGLGLAHTPDGKGLFLMAVNRHSDGKFSIESYDVDSPDTAPRLTPEASIESGALINPQDVAMVAPGSFYVANGTAGANPALHALQSWGLLAGGNILYFNGMVFKPVMDGMYGIRSLLLTPDGSHVIAGGLLSRDVRSFTRDNFSGALTDAGTLDLPGGAEKLSFSSGGYLWAAAHPNLVEWRGAQADPGKRAASDVVRVTLQNGEPKSVGTVYGNAGAEISGASVAVAVGGRLLIGSSLDGKLLDCTAH